MKYKSCLTRKYTNCLVNFFYCLSFHGNCFNFNNMKKIFVLIFVVFSTVMVKAQILNPVSWRISSKIFGVDVKQFSNKADYIEVVKLIPPVKTPANFQWNICCVITGNVYHSLQKSFPSHLINKDV